jgi:hypothetical protein
MKAQAHKNYNEPGHNQCPNKHRSTWVFTTNKMCKLIDTTAGKRVITSYVRKYNKSSLLTFDQSICRSIFVSVSDILCGDFVSH